VAHVYQRTKQKAVCNATIQQPTSSFRATLQTQAQHLMNNTVARTTSTQYSIFWNKWKTFIELWNDTTKPAHTQEADYYLTSLSAQLQTTAIIHFISWLFFHHNAKNIAAILSGVKHQFKIAWQPTEMFNQLQVAALKSACQRLQSQQGVQTHQRLPLPFAVITQQLNRLPLTCQRSYMLRTGILLAYFAFYA
jgi:hypothetical protein